MSRADWVINLYVRIMCPTLPGLSGICFIRASFSLPRKAVRFFYAHDLYGRQFNVTKGLGLAIC